MSRISEPSVGLFVGSIFLYRQRRTTEGTPKLRYFESWLSINPGVPVPCCRPACLSVRPYICLSLSVFMSCLIRPFHSFVRMSVRPLIYLSTTSLSAGPSRAPQITWYMINSPKCLPSESSSHIVFLALVAHIVFECGPDSGLVQVIAVKRYIEHSGFIGPSVFRKEEFIRSCPHLVFVTRSGC